MGFGDTLIAAGLAERLFHEDPSAGPVRITDCGGSLRDQPCWHGNPAIGLGPRSVRCGGGCLPYLQYPRQPDCLTFSPTYRAADNRGHLYLTDAERNIGLAAKQRYGSYVLVEPYPRDRQNLNRQWPLDSWQQLITLLQRTCTHAIVQFDHAHATRIPSLPAIPTPTFRGACGLLTHARLLIALEGGLVFASAALGTPTVALWGGCISAPVLSFPEHVNLVDEQPETPCGRTKPCLHCEMAWHLLTPELVADRVLRCLRSRAA